VQNLSLKKFVCYNKTLSVDCLEVGCPKQVKFVLTSPVHLMKGNI